MHGSVPCPGIGENRRHFYLSIIRTPQTTLGGVEKSAKGISMPTIISFVVFLFGKVGHFKDAGNRAWSGKDRVERIRYSI